MEPRLGGGVVVLGLAVVGCGAIWGLDDRDGRLDESSAAGSGAGGSGGEGATSGIGEGGAGAHGAMGAGAGPGSGGAELVGWQRVVGEASLAPGGIHFHDGRIVLVGEHHEAIPWNTGTLDVDESHEVFVLTMDAESGDAVDASTLPTQGVDVMATALLSGNLTIVGTFDDHVGNEQLVGASDGFIGKMTLFGSTDLGWTAHGFADTRTSFVATDGAVAVGHIAPGSSSSHDSVDAKLVWHSADARLQQVGLGAAVVPSAVASIGTTNVFAGTFRASWTFEGHSITGGTQSSGYVLWPDGDQLVMPDVKPEHLAVQRGEVLIAMVADGGVQIPMLTVEPPSSGGLVVVTKGRPADFDWVVEVEGQRQSDGDGGEWELVTQMVPHEDGGAVLCGQASQALSLRTSVSTVEVTRSFNSGAAFVARIAPDGTIAWVHTTEEGDGERCAGLTLVGQDVVVAVAATMPFSFLGHAVATPTVTSDSKLVVIRGRPTTL